MNPRPYYRWQRPRRRPDDLEFEPRRPLPPPPPPPAGGPVDPQHLAAYIEGKIISIDFLTGDPDGMNPAYKYQQGRRAAFAEVLEIIRSGDIPPPR